MAALCAGAQANDAASRHLERGIGLAHDGKFPEAANEFLRALALDPRLAEAHYLLGLVRQSWGKWADARASYEAALRLEPRYAEAQLGLAAVLTRLADDEPGREAAMQACRKAMELNPREAEPHFHLGNLEKQEGNLERAAAAFETALRLQAQYPGGRLALADVLVDLRAFDRAVPMLEALARTQPGNARVHHLLGMAASRQGNAAGAVGHLRTAARLDPANPQTHYVLAMNLRKLGQTEEASRETARYQELTAGKESAMQARYHLGLAQKLLAGGKLEEAIGAYQESLSYRRDAAVATDLGVALLTAGRIEEAIEVLREVAAGDPRSVLAQYHLGLAYARKSSYPEARRALGAALEARPEFPEALFSLGMAFAMEGRLEEAEKHLRESIRLRPDQAPSRYYLGVVLKERGRAAEAEAEFEAARQIDPKFRPGPPQK
jgi:tetratricopeptide (TPR) repeat protein